MSPGARSEGRLAALLGLPVALCVLAVAVLPMLWTVWESLHRHDLRLPWLGRPRVGLANYAEALAEARFWDALAHTLFFVVASVGLEMLLGLLLALLLHRAFRGRGALRTLALLPWAIPTVVAALVWRFLFEGAPAPGGVPWLADATLAWVPVVLADVWKTTPFVALLLLAGLQSMDEALLEAARVDGATAWRSFLHVTLPLLRPALLVALVFRTLDAFRVFDLVVVLTGGGPGTATEPLALYTFGALLQELRFGYGAALSVIAFGVGFALALAYVRLVGRR